MRGVPLYPTYTDHGKHQVLVPATRSLSCDAYLGGFERCVLRAWTDVHFYRTLSPRVIGLFVLMCIYTSALASVHEISSLRSPD